MRSKLAPVAAFIVASLGLTLASCSSSSDSPTTAGGNTSAGSSAASGGSPAVEAAGDPVTISLGSWRTEDLAIWEDEIIPAFEAAHPGIKVDYTPTDTNDYNAAIQSQIEGGTGPDVLMCRPFDVNRAWIADGYFDPLTDLDAIKNFDDTALAAWTGDDDKPYCVPVASVLAGFYYNKTIFSELGLTVPTTWTGFLDVLQKIKDNGKYSPLALGTADGWQLAYNVLYNVGPNWWKGEEGRNGLIDGTKKLTDPDFVQAFTEFDKLKDFLPSGYQSLTYDDMAQLFSLGQAAILPDGSWNINQATSTGIDVGIFGAPAPDGGQRYQQEMPDMGMGLNSASKQKEAATTFLEWLGTPEFQQLYVNKLPGFFAMAKTPVTYDNALATEFASLKEGADLTPRLALDRLSAGTPPLDDEMWRVAQLMFNSDLSAEDATAELQKSLDSWYKPAK